MSSYARTSVLTRSSRGVAGAPALRVSISERRADSCVRASRISFAAFSCADTIGVSARTRISVLALTKLRIHLFEVALVHEDLARLASGAGRDETFRLHHVDEPR